MRYTQSAHEVHELVRVHEILGLHGIKAVTLIDGQKFTGLIRGSRSGNNGGPGQPTAYYGSVTLQMQTGDQVEIDLLDIKDVFDVTERMMPEFEKLGIVKIVSLTGVA